MATPRSWNSKLDPFAAIIALDWNGILLRPALYQYPPHQMVAFLERGGFMPVASPQPRTSQPRVIFLFFWTPHVISLGLWQPIHSNPVLKCSLMQAFWSISCNEFDCRNWLEWAKCVTSWSDGNNFRDNFQQPLPHFPFGWYRVSHKNIS